MTMERIERSYQIKQWQLNCSKKVLESGTWRLSQLYLHLNKLGMRQYFFTEGELSKKRHESKSFCCGCKCNVSADYDVAAGAACMVTILLHKRIFHNVPIKNVKQPWIKSLGFRDSYRKTKIRYLNVVTTTKSQRAFAKFHIRNSELWSKFRHFWYLQSFSQNIPLLQKMSAQRKHSHICRISNEHPRTDMAAADLVLMATPLFFAMLRFRSVIRSS